MKPLIHKIHTLQADKHANRDFAFFFVCVFERT